ncbi:hypothetical protein L1S32_08820 [Methanogenium sp. S4BF]|uniref:hypothetical protein n=1 Tax=Methanogenium sp. S4BF TaxID=1789226 RepID=UPI00241629D4|nr:hypothetical protein [Methanogenium sp. S4BF]WFN33944.1 hypothetical protein L1S32_08820 [Methanogenium sp. S4BF]
MWYGRIAVLFVFTLRRGHHVVGPHAVFLTNAGSHTPGPVAPDRAVICSADDAGEV